MNNPGLSVFFCTPHGMHDLYVYCVNLMDSGHLVPHHKVKI
jgi:hypothetical protein